MLIIKAKRGMNICVSILAVLKGVTIRDNSIVGACSVVTKNIPANVVWAGNPVVFIRKGISRDVVLMRQDGET